MNLNLSLNQLLLAGIIGIVSIGVSSMMKMSEAVQDMAISVQQLNLRMGHVTDAIKDHEERLRVVEHQKPKKE